MICQPIIIDGPARGKKMTVEGRNFVVIKSPRRLTVHDYVMSSPDQFSLPALEQVLYNIFHFKLGEFTFALATVKHTPPTTQKALSVILTASARQALVQ